MISHPNGSILRVKEALFIVMPVQQAFRIILHPKTKFYQMVLKPCLARNVSLEITHETFYLD